MHIESDNLAERTFAATIGSEHNPALTAAYVPVDTIQDGCVVSYESHLR